MVEQEEFLVLLSKLENSVGIMILFAKKHMVLMVEQIVDINMELHMENGNKYIIKNSLKYKEDSY